METPMSTSIKLDMDESGNKVNITKYRGMIGSLFSLTDNRLDIMLVYVCVLDFNLFLENHTLSIVKGIFRYLFGTINLGHQYPKHTHMDLISYSDADFIR